MKHKLLVLIELLQALAVLLLCTLVLGSIAEAQEGGVYVPGYPPLFCHSVYYTDTVLEQHTPTVHRTLEKFGCIVYRF